MTDNIFCELLRLNSCLRQQKECALRTVVVLYLLIKCTLFKVSNIRSIGQFICSCKISISFFLLEYQLIKPTYMIVRNKWIQGFFFQTFPIHAEKDHWKKIANIFHASKSSDNTSYQLLTLNSCLCLQKECMLSYVLVLHPPTKHTFVFEGLKDNAALDTALDSLFCSG